MFITAENFNEEKNFDLKIFFEVLSGVSNLYATQIQSKFTIDDEIC